MTWSNCALPYPHIYASQPPGVGGFEVTSSDETKLLGSYQSVCCKCLFLWYPCLPAMSFLYFDNISAHQPPPEKIPHSKHAGPDLQKEGTRSARKNDLWIHKASHQVIPSINWAWENSTSVVCMHLSYLFCIHSGWKKALLQETYLRIKHCQTLVSSER